MCETKKTRKGPYYFLPNPNFFIEITFVEKSKNMMTIITARNPTRDDDPFALASAVESVSGHTEGHEGHEGHEGRREKDGDELM